MNDLEERLRADMLDATDAIFADLDLDSVMSSGDRVLRGRAVRRSLGAVAAVAAAGLIAYAGFAGRPITGVPAPAAPVSSTVGPAPTEPATPSDPWSTTFDIGGEINGQVPSYNSIRVAVQPAGATTDVTVTLSPVRGRPVNRHYSIPAGRFWQVTLDKHTVIGIIPDRISRLDSHGGAAKGSFFTSQPLDGIGATAFWVGFPEAGAPADLRGFVWQGSDGEFHDSLGSTVPSARIALKGEEYLVYRDAELDVMQVVRASGGSWGLRISDLHLDDLLGGGAGKRDASGTATWMVMGALPPGIHDLSLTLAPGDGEWAAQVLSDGYTVILAVNTSNSADGDVVRSLTYTDASGKVVHLPR
jgi:hypothetical protein